ncbi:MAG: hypothetical protein JXK04_05930 [Campylobacterales bacterium]|nr:hypothetical protein [Campylobacterales bacterium]
MQIRELSPSERDDGFALLSALHPDLTSDQFNNFLISHSPQTYRPIGAYERNVLCIYAGVSIHENLALGRYLQIDDFVVREEDEKSTGEMIEFLGDYAKLHRCQNILLLGKNRGLRIEDLKGFRPKRDGFLKRL